MKPIFWKEWRENYGWALLGAGLMVLAGLYTQNSGYSGDWYATWSNNFPLPFTILAPILATALGFLQSMRELRRDQWAFLVHRPVGRGQIFAGKVLAGLLLYGLATMVPLLLRGWWLSVPGRLPGPFFWQLLLPAIASVLAGTPFYFAAFVTAMRPARWYGSRALGLPAAVLCSLLILPLNEFWQALLAILAFSALTGTAAYSCFVSGGDYRKQGQGGRAALGSLLLLGITTLGFCTLGMLSSLLERPRYYGIDQYMLTPQGEPVRIQGESPNGALKVTDMAGRPVPPLKGKKRWEFNDLLSQTTISNRWATSGFRYGYREPRRFAEPLDDYDTANNWFYLPGEKRFYGYSGPNKQFLGTIGSNGFAAPGEPLPHPFQGERLNLYPSGREDNFLAFTSGLYELHLDDRELTPLFQTPAGQQVEAAAVGPYLRSEQVGQQVTAATKTDLYFIQSYGKRIIRLPLASETLSGKPFSLQLYTNGQRYYLWYRGETVRPDNAAGLPTSLVTVSNAGKVLERRQITFPATGSGSAPKTDTTYTPLAVFAPTALVLAFGLYLMGGQVFQAEAPMRMLSGLESDPGPVWLFLGYILLGAVVGAVLCWKIAGRCQLPRSGRLQWLIGGLLLGPLGVLMLLGLLEWPALETCAACGRKRVVPRETCEHCGAPWPKPQPDGTEIFPDTGPVGVNSAVKV